MNDDNTNFEAVELSPTRAELIARVRSRGRQIRARRRLGVASIAAVAVAVVAIAAPAIAIGSRSSTSHRVPATAAPAKGDFRVAPVERTSSPPCAPGTLGFEAVCLEVGKTVVDASDVVDASVVHVDTSWIVNLTVKASAIQRLAALAPGQAAIIVGGRVVGTPPMTAGLTGTKLQIARDGLTRAEAIALAKAAMGEAPARVDPQQDLTTRIELDSDRLVAGSSLKGTLVVENHTDNLPPAPRVPVRIIAAQD